MNIIFVRHGLTSANEQHLFCGRTNCELSVAGREQVKLCAEQFREANVDAWLCGTSKRSEQTLEIIFDDLVIPKEVAVFMDDIREINFGEFENYSQEELEIQYPDLINDYLNDWENFTFPGGDSVRDYFSYCNKSIFKILGKYYDCENICIVGSKGYICAAICALKGLGLEHMFEFDIDCGQALMMSVDIFVNEEGYLELGNSRPENDTESLD